MIQKQITPKSHNKTSITTENVKITPNHTKRHQTTPKANQLKPKLTSIISHKIIQKQITPKSHNKSRLTQQMLKSHQTTPKDTKPHQKQTNSDLI